MMSQSLTEILNETLNLENDVRGCDSSLPVASTSSILLKAIKNRQEKQEHIESIKAAPSFERPLDPLLLQISESNAEAPKYWKGLGIKSLSQSSSRCPQLPTGNKSRQVKKNKGESYKDKLSERLVSKSERRRRLEQLSKIY